MSSSAAPAAPAASDAAAGGGSRGHCVFFDAGSDPAAVHNLMRTELLDFVRRCGFDPGADMQVVTHGHAGALGTHALNVLFRSLLNPTDADVTADTRGGGDGDGTAAAPATPDDVYAPRRLDRVMQTRNNYDTGAMNGDTGHVEGVHEPDPNDAAGGAEPFYLVAFDDGDSKALMPAEYALRRAPGSTPAKAAPGRAPDAIEREHLKVTVVRATSVRVTWDPPQTDGGHAITKAKGELDVAKMAAEVQAVTTSAAAGPTVASSAQSNKTMRHSPN